MTYCNAHLRKGVKALTLMDYPLMKQVKSKQQEAETLHRKFLAFKQRYEALPNA